jgi:hypothetical protein
MCGHITFARDAIDAKSTSATQPVKDPQAIEQSMKKLFDKPDAPLNVASISIEGGYAVAGWIQDQRGGRALLKRENGLWSIAVCGGDGLKQASVLAQAGLPQKNADRLAQKVRQTESKLAPEQLKKFSLFEGMMKVDNATHGHDGDHHKR